MKRRHVLRGGIAVLALPLAGCTGDEATQTGSETPAPSPPGTKTATGTATKATTEPSTATASKTPTETSTETVGGTPPETRSDIPDGTGTETATGTPGTTTTTPSADQTVVVGPDGTLRFEPAEFDITAGDTVLWKWDSDGHNVRPSSTPAQASWSGTPGGDDTTYDAGYTYRYTFEVTGKYDYYCAPHRQFGMTGSFTVK